MSNKLAVHLVTWNGAQYIPYLFASLKNQTLKDWTLIVLDNNSSDDTIELIQKELINFPVQSRLIVNQENKGFAGGHNQLYAQTESKYFALLNQDLYLEPDCLEKLVTAIELDETIAVVSPRLMKWNFTLLNHDALDGSVDHHHLPQSFTDTIDSLGLCVLRNRRVIEIGVGEPYSIRKCDDRIEVFGVSGTLPMFRRSMIESIEFSLTEFFDSLYHLYKEDVDLAYRIQSADWHAFTICTAVAYHDRSATGPKEIGDSAAANNKKQQSSWVKYHSYKNHLATLYKNEYWQNFLLDFPWIMWYELKKFIWFLVFDPTVLTGLKELWSNRASLRTKKKIIQSKRKMTWKKMRIWWT